VEEECVVASEVRAVFEGLNGPVVLHKVIISRMLVQNIPVIHINEPHEPMPDPKHHCHKHRITPYIPMEIALNAESKETELSHHHAVTKLIQGADVSFSQGEVIEPRQVIEGVDEIIKPINAHRRPNIQMLISMIPHPRLFVMKSHCILIDKVHFPFIMLRVGMMGDVV
jgi:hypothetical protein